ncbi:MAG: VWA domain-containing protein [Tateyamaria sp.]
MGGEKKRTGDPGAEPPRLERVSHRAFSQAGPEAELARFRRLAPKRLPRRRSYRHAADKLGKIPDLRKTLRDAAKRDGEVFTLSMRRRKDRQRKIVLLIDVSGSMKDRTEAALTFAHTLVQVAERAEVFTLGTRLTRVTPALRLKNQERAFERVSNLVSDVDGGTRIGEALAAFLSVPRYAGFARGAAVIVLSDGLERGTPDTMIDAVRRLSRFAWRLDWLTPLGTDADFTPATNALSAILPDLDDLTDGSTTSAIVHHVLSLSSSRRRVA